MTTKVRHDANTGQGYGVTKAVFHVPRQSGDVYPYIDDDSDLEKFTDDDTEESISSKVYTPMKTDFYSKKDPFYFAAGNTKLSDCFFRTDKVLREVHAMGDSMSPIPASKKSRTSAASGASFPQGVSNFRRTGSKRGYFSAPPKVKVDIETIPNYEDEDDSIDNLEDLARKQDMLKGNFSV